MADIMIDLETMGSGPDAAIVAIGLVEMSVEFGIERSLYHRVDLRSSVAAGGVMDPDTVMWWLRKDQQARDALQFADPTDRAAHGIESVLADVVEWIDDIQDMSDTELRVWGNGADFDLPILSSAIRSVYGPDERVWPYWGGRCYRTLKNLRRDIKAPPRSGVHHNALDDARHQAEHWVQIMRAMAPAPADFKGRVRTEAAELQARIDKLAAFQGTDQFQALPNDEQDRMLAQLAAMQDYSGCLIERIAAFSDGGSA